MIQEGLSDKMEFELALEKMSKNVKGQSRENSRPFLGKESARVN